MAHWRWGVLALTAILTTCSSCLPPAPMPGDLSVGPPRGSGSSTWLNSPPLEPYPVTAPQGRPPVRLGRGQLPADWQPDASPREWTSIVLHHTATDHGSVESIHESHLDKKWLGIGYHFVIGNGNGMADGAVESTFRWRQQLHGAHAGDDEYNEHGIGIALVGNFEKAPPSAAQLAAVKQLVGTLRAVYAVPVERVIGHSDVKATACPGRYFPTAEVSRSLGMVQGSGPGFEGPSQPGRAAALALDHRPRPAARSFLASSAAAK